PAKRDLCRAIGGYRSARDRDGRGSDGERRRCDAVAEHGGAHPCLASTMTMQFDLAGELDRSIPCGTLTVWERDWDVYVFGATRIDRDWFLQLALVGPQVRTVTVRVGPAPDR